MPSIKFTIATPEKLVMEREVSQVTLPTHEGEVTILPHHIPLVGILKPGTISIKTDGKEKMVAVSGGFFKVSGTEVRVLADSAEHAEDLDISKIEEAKERAEKALEDARNREDTDYAGLSAILERELARLKTARKHHTHRHIAE
jgi:F-type H+-transporting ATPase subunit epsilon